MAELKMTITLTEDAQIQVEGPPDIPSRLALICAAYEITARMLVPIMAPQESSILSVPKGLRLS